MTSTPLNFDPVALYNEATGDFNAQRYDVAEEKALIVYNKEKSWVHASAFLAEIKIAQGKERDAQDILENYLTHHPLDVFISNGQFASTHFARVMHNAGLHRDAVALIGFFLEHWPANLELSKQLANIQESLGDLSTAATIRKDILRHQTSSEPGVMFQLAAWPAAPASRSQFEALRDPIYGGLELDPWEATPEDIAKVVDDHGVALIRGLLSPDWVKRVHGVLENSFLDRDLAAQREELDEKNYFDHVKIRVIELGDHSPSEVNLFDVPVSNIFTTPYFWRMVKLLKGGWPARVLAPEARWSDPEGRYALPFHQDSHDVTERRVNIWIPLQDCGADAPGLAFIPHRLRHVEEREISDRSVYAEMGFEIPASRIAAEYGDHIWRPKYRAGDVVVFHSLTIHTTDIQPGMTKPRLSLEARYL